MLKNFIQNLTEPKHGRTIHEFAKAPLSTANRSALNFIVNEKNGAKSLYVVLEEDEGHEVDREYCQVDIDCLDDLERLIADVKNFVRDNS